jgi:OOP family OmpA-OmpF porin
MTIQYLQTSFNELHGEFTGFSSTAAGAGPDCRRHTPNEDTHMNYWNKTAIVAAAIIAAAPLTTAADGHFYAGASVGSASLSEQFDGFDVDDSSVAARLVAGWQFGDYFSLEAGYQIFGTFQQRFDVDGESVDVALKADGFTLGATGNLPLGEKFALYGRIGSFFWDGDADINGVTQAQPEDTNLYLGVGIRYAMTDRLSVVADWTRFALDDVDSDTAAIGMLLRF